MTRKERAAQLHKMGYNCAQAVACAFEDLVDMDSEDLFKITEAFGAGMGGMRGTCGAVSGATLIISLKNSVGSSDTSNKGKTYKIARQISSEFEKKNGALDCHDLKGIETGVVLRKCPDCISDAVELLEGVLAAQE